MAPLPCARCGVTNASLDPHGLCPVCRVAGQFPDRETRERVALMHELGMPVDHLWRRTWLQRVSPEAIECKMQCPALGGLLTWTMTVDDEGRWEPFPPDYEVETFGREAPWPNTPPYCRLIFHTIEASGRKVDRVFAIQNWRERARFKDSPIYAELRWHPERGETGGVFGPPHAMTPAAEAAARRGLNILRALPTNVRGRRRGSVKVRPELFRELAPVLWREYVKEWGHAPSDAEFARYIGMRPRTFSRRLAECREEGMTWPPI